MTKSQMATMHPKTKLGRLILLKTVDDCMINHQMMTLRVTLYIFKAHAIPRDIDLAIKYPKLHLTACIFHSKGYNMNRIPVNPDYSCKILYGHRTLA